MSKMREFLTIQNPAIGALALWAFVDEYLRTTNPPRGPVLPLLFPILPLVFHQDTREALSGRQLQGGLYRALAQVRALPAGLQRRMESMAPQTMLSLRTACAAGLLAYDRQTTEVVPVRRTLPASVRSGNEVKPILQTSRRLGYWFATIPLAQLGLLLDLEF